MQLFHLAQVEETAVVLVISGMPEVNDFESPFISINDIAVSNDDSFNTLQILGRRYGPFDGPPGDNIDFTTQVWSLLNSRLRSLDDFQSRIATALALRCPRMRQRALENILLEQQHYAVDGVVEPGFIGLASTSTANDNIVLSSSSSATTSSAASSGTWIPGIVDDDITVEEPEFWDRFEANNHNNDNINDFSINDEDVFYLDFDAEDDEAPVEMLLPFNRHQTKPLVFNPFEQQQNHDEIHRQSKEQQPVAAAAVVPADVIFSATVYTDFYGNDDGIPSALGGYDNEVVNWQLWNEDGSLNTGLILFIALCAASSVVWSALLLQCASMAYAWVTCCSRNCGNMKNSCGSCGGRNQFLFLGSDSESEEEEEEEVGGFYQRARKGNVVIAAEYTEG